VLGSSTVQAPVPPSDLTPAITPDTAIDFDLLGRALYELTRRRTTWRQLPDPTRDLFVREARRMWATSRRHLAGTNQVPRQAIVDEVLERLSAGAQHARHIVHRGDIWRDRVICLADDVLAFLGMMQAGLPWPTVWRDARLGARPGTPDPGGRSGTAVAEAQPCTTTGRR
jgi:hypothetical protein